MPTYVYECAKCGDEFELYQSFSDEPLKKHPGCGGKVAKVFQPVGIVLKGSGFYKNDSRGGKRTKSDAPKADAATSSDSSSSGNGSSSSGNGSSGNGSSSSESKSSTSSKKSESSSTSSKKSS